MIQLTFLTSVWLVAVLLFRRNVASLLMISAVFQASSILNLQVGGGIGGVSTLYGISPYMGLALVAGVLWLFKLSIDRRVEMPPHLRWPFFLLCAYAIVACTGALFLPRVFEGLAVNLLAEKYGLHELTRLRPTLANMAQPVNLIAHGVVMLYLFQHVKTEVDRERLLWGVGVAGALSLLVGLYQQWASFKNLPGLLPYLATNPGYEQASVAGQFFWFRVGLPFTEPSYASTYFAAMAVGCWAVVFLGTNWRLMCVAAILCSAGLLNSLGVTGMAAAGTAIIFLILWIGFLSLRTGTSSSRRYRAAVVWLISLLTMAAGYCLYLDTAVKPQIDAVVSELIVSKLTSRDGVRELSNRRALEIVLETYGLGVGMGSNRASSFLASLISNTGVLGCSLFMAMLGSLIWRYWNAPVLSDPQIFTVTALLTATLAVSFGIPDLNIPMYWCFVFLAFLFSPAPSAHTSPSPVASGK